jgi:ribosome recycling factor
VVDHLENELKAIRTGRANAALVENIRVEAYGSSMELKGVAAVSIPDFKTIQIEAWDKNLVKDIEKAIIAADIGLTPNVAGQVIRLIMPAPTEETRRDTVKRVHAMGEQSRIGVRNVREEVRESVLKAEKDKELSEDERFRELEQLDKVAREWNDKIDASVKAKEEEVMTV